MWWAKTKVIFAKPWNTCGPSLTRLRITGAGFEGVYKQSEKNFVKKIQISYLIPLEILLRNLRKRKSFIILSFFHSRNIFTSNEMFLVLKGYRIIDIQEIQTTAMIVFEILATAITDLDKPSSLFFVWRVIVEVESILSARSSTCVYKIYYLL